MSDRDGASAEGVETGDGGRAGAAEEGGAGGAGGAETGAGGAAGGAEETGGRGGGGAGAGAAVGAGRGSAGNGAGAETDAEGTAEGAEAGEDRPGETAEGCGGPAAGAGAAVTASPSLAITPTTVLIGTVVPGWTRISFRVPEAGAGISASTLSVEISKSGSSRCTLSPTFFIHFVTVPSAMDSPIWGMMTSVMVTSGLTASLGASSQ